MNEACVLSAKPLIDPVNDPVNAPLAPTPGFGPLSPRPGEAGRARDGGFEPHAARPASGTGKPAGPRLARQGQTTPLSMVGAGAGEPTGPNHAFEDSRRLTGPSRWYAGTAVTLSPLGPAATNRAAHKAWAARVANITQALGWPDAQAQVHRHASGVFLLLAAPPDQLFTATEINEWAWECSAAPAPTPDTDKSAPFDIAHRFSDATAPNVFATRAQAEAQPRWRALQAAADAHGLLLLADDDTVSIGAGAGSCNWPLKALPTPADVAWATLHNVPTVLVTGSNGKTTTTRLLAAIGASAGLRSGLCSTEGVFVAGDLVTSGDYAGPAGARTVLRHPQVQWAVLETARGGLLRRGLAVARAQVAVLTNISPDHLGEYGIDSAADLAEVKLSVARALGGSAGVLVLNADDAVLMATAERLPHARAATWALFAHDHQHPALQTRRASGGNTCGVRPAAADDKASAELVLSIAGIEHRLGAVTDIPITLGGAARHNLHNAAAAALAAAALGLPISAIVATLARFGAHPEDNAGRLEHWSHHGATVLIDYAHNPDGLAQLLQVARALRPRRLALLLGQAGNRDNAALHELAATAARFGPDRVMLKELPQMLRGRAPGEVSALLKQGLLANGLASEQVHSQADEKTAALALLAWAQAGDVVLLPIHTAAVRASLRAFLVNPPQPR